MTTTTARVYALLFLVVVATGCVDPDAPAKCTDIRDRYCAKAEALCATPTADCVASFEEVATCADAIGIEETHGACIAAIETLTVCPSALPSDCAGVVLFPPGSL